MNVFQKVVRRIIVRKTLLELCTMVRSVKNDSVIKLVYEYLVQNQMLVKYKTKQYQYLTDFLYLKKCVDESMDHEDNTWLVDFLGDIIKEHDIFDCGIYVYLVELLTYYFKERLNVQQTKK